MVASGALALEARRRAPVDTPPGDDPGIGVTVPLTLIAMAAAAMAPDAFHPSAIGRLQLLVAAAAGATMVLWVVLRPAVGDPAVRLVDLLIRHAPRPYYTAARVLRPRTSPMFWVLSIALAAAVVAGVAHFLSFGPLGHDEAVYAVKARGWLDGTPVSGWGDYRPVGMAAVGWFLLHIGDGETVLRSFGVVSSVLAVGALWYLGWRLYRPASGLLAPALFAVAPTFLRRAPEFLNDLASAALLLAVMWLLWRFLEQRDGAGWSVLWAAPLAAAAFYLRYGSGISLLVIAAVAAAVWWRSVLAGWVRLLATAALFAALLVPHAMAALDETGSITGILSAAHRAAGSDSFGEGLSTYLRWFPANLAGRISGAAMLVGTGLLLVALARSLWRRTLASHDRATIFVGAVAWLSLVATGLTAHAEPRYVFLTIMLLLLLGSEAALLAARWLPRPLLLAALVAAAAVVVWQGVTGYRDARDDFADLAETRQVIVDAAAALDDASPGTCSVVTAHEPQIGWYSGCVAVGFGFPTDPPRFPPADDRYLLLFAHGRRQPEGRQLEAYLEAEGGVPTIVVPAMTDTIGDAAIYRVAPEASP